eukprot:6205987-Pleurochrysis_carterae.AAC.1
MESLQTLANLLLSRLPAMHKARGTTRARLARAPGGGRHWRETGATVWREMGARGSGGNRWLQFVE